MLISKSGFIAWLVILLYITLFFIKPTNLASSDLGRHLENGRHFLAGSSSVLQSNFYSYTQPQYHFINHHWLFGVLSYSAWKLAGFPLLTIIGVVGYMGSISLLSLWSIKTKQAGWLGAGLALLVTLPALTYRVETRPEAISQLFLVICIILWTYLYQDSQSQKKIQVTLAIISLTAVQILWINLHIYFVFNLLLGCCFLIFTIITRQWRKLAVLANTLVLLILASGITPLGYQILLYPLQILNEYSYPVAENQSFFFFLQYRSTQIYWWFITGLLLMTAVSIVLSLKKVPHHLKPLLLTSLLIASMSVVMVRFIPVFVLLSLPLMSWFISKLLLRIHHLFSTPAGKNLQPVVAVSFSLFLSLAIGWILLSGLYNPWSSPIALGLSYDPSSLIQFLNQEELRNKPVFNNYDIGGLLIWSMPNVHYVFVDNRPEAYPAQFMTESYIGAQQDDQVWQKILSQHQIELIVFNHFDATDWGRPFLEKRLQDPSWQVVYLDDQAIVLLLAIPSNQKILELFKKDTVQ